MKHLIKSLIGNVNKLCGEVGRVGNNASNKPQSKYLQDIIRPGKLGRQSQLPSFRRLALNVAGMFADPSKTMSQPASRSYPEMVGNVNNNIRYAHWNPPSPACQILLKFRLQELCLIRLRLVTCLMTFGYRH
jgi:hypothetical protein